MQKGKLHLRDELWVELQKGVALKVQDRSDCEHYGTIPGYYVRTSEPTKYRLGVITLLMLQLKL